MRIADSVLLTCWPPAPCDAHGVDLQIRFVDLDVDVLGFRQHGDRRGRGVDAALRFGVRHALHAMHAGFEFQLGEGAAAADFGDDFLVAAHGAFARGDHLDLPALLGGIALVHAEQIAGEQRGLVAAGAGADFEDDVALVHRVLRQQRQADLLLELVAPRLAAAAFSPSASARISASVAGSAMQRLAGRRARGSPRDRP